MGINHFLVCERVLVYIDIEEAKSSLVELIEAAIDGEDIFIINDDRQVIQLVPIRPQKRQPKFGSAKGLIKISEDFDEYMWLVL